MASPSWCDSCWWEENLPEFMPSCIVEKLLDLWNWIWNFPRKGSLATLHHFHFGYSWKSQEQSAMVLARKWLPRSPYEPVNLVLAITWIGKLGRLFLPSHWLSLAHSCHRHIETPLNLAFVLHCCTYLPNKGITAIILAESLLGLILAWTCLLKQVLTDLNSFCLPSFLPGWKPGPVQKLHYITNFLIGNRHYLQVVAVKVVIISSKHSPNSGQKQLLHRWVIFWA